MQETHIMLVRHPETQANIEGRLIGRGDSPFTEVGSLQVPRIVRRIVDFAPDVVWSSPLQRALVVATSAAEVIAAPMKVDERLSELDFGVAEGMTYDEIAEAQISFNFENETGPVAPGAESRASVFERTAAVCDDIIGQGGRHVIVSHGGVVRSAVVDLLGLSRDRIWSFHVSNALIVHIKVVEGHGILEEYAVA